MQEIFSKSLDSQSPPIAVRPHVFTEHYLQPCGIEGDISSSVRSLK